MAQRVPLSSPSLQVSKRAGIIRDLGHNCDSVSNKFNPASLPGVPPIQLTLIVQ